MGWREVLLSIFSALIFVGALISVIGISSFALLDANSYLPYFEEHGIYNYFDNAMRNISVDEFILLPGQDVRTIVEYMMNGVFDYLNGKSDTLNISLGLDSSSLIYFYESKVRDLPICSKAGIRDGNITCRPVNESVDAFTKRVLRERNISLTQNTINLGDYIDRDGKIEGIRRGIQFYKLVVYWSIAVTMVLIALTLWTGWPLRTRGLRNVGAPLFFAGLGIFGLFHTSASIGINALTAVLPANAGVMDPTALAVDVINGLSSRFTINSIVLAVIGAVLFVCSFLFARDEED